MTESQGHFPYNETVKLNNIGYKVAFGVSKYNSSSLWDGTDFYGASLKSFDKILRNQYKLVCCNITGANAFFVRNDLLSDKFINDFSPEYHFNEENYWLRLAFKKTCNIRIK